MELGRENFRTIIFYNFLRKLSPQECFDEMKALIGDEVPSIRTIYFWFNEFKRGRLSLTDEAREGRPKSAVVPENIDAVQEMVTKDRHVTYREIKAKLDISPTSVHKILHEHLAVKLKTDKPKAPKVKAAAKIKKATARKKTAAVKK